MIYLFLLVDIFFFLTQFDSEDARRTLIKIGGESNNKKKYSD